jgi:hypothetical protein
MVRSGGIFPEEASLRSIGGIHLPTPAVESEGSSPREWAAQPD